MFGSAILEIAIGLIFVYLLLGLICSTLNELFAMFGNSRAENLRQGVQVLLRGENQQELLQHFYAHPLIKSLAKGSGGGLMQKFVELPLLNLFFKENKYPSYIPPRTFVLTLLDKFAPAHKTPGTLTLDDLRKALNKKNPEWPINDELKQILHLLINDAEARAQIHGGDPLKHLQANLEEWFNQTMERVTGWYKRKTQLWSLLTAAALTIVLNVDTISVAHSFATNAALRASIVAAAEKQITQPLVLTPSSTQASPEDTKKKFEELKTQMTGLRQFGFPMGWEAETDWTTSKIKFISKILGLLLTICAASLGAPFWFDMLKKVISIRTSGRSPEEVLKFRAELLQAEHNR